MKNAGLILWSSLLSIFLFTASCERSEGEGGKATIEGYVYKIVDDGTIAVKDTLYTDKDGIIHTKLYSFVKDTIVAAGEDVYIIYGGEGGKEKEWNRVRTLYNGKYVFPYLVGGNYSVYAYNNLPNKVDIPELYSLKIGKKGVHRVPDIYINVGKNAGLSAIVGQVRAVYDGMTNPMGKERMDVRVYLKQRGTINTDDTRTDNDGRFVFTKLLPGEYIVWAATEEFSNRKDQIDPFDVDVEIPQVTNANGSFEQQIVVMEDPMVIRLTYEK